MDRLFERVSNTIHATVYGTLESAAAQGLLGGLMFWWLGLSAPLLWGVVMALLAIVPVLGAFVVWVPAALVLALEGSWGKALILVLWGMLVVGTIDNLLRPILVGKRLEQHTVLAFISVVGGLLLFGPAGLIRPGSGDAHRHHGAARGLAEPRAHRAEDLTRVVPTRSRDSRRVVSTLHQGTAAG